MRKLFLFSVCFLIINIAYLNSNIKINASENKFKARIDQNLEKIRIELERENYNEVCKIANSTSLIIKNKKSSLKKIEPYYNWEAIQELLNNLPITNCSQRN